MRYHILATDYDGTLSASGKVTPDTIAALKKLKASGRKLVLVTGRQLQDLIAVFPEHSLFDRIVAENGGVLYAPAILEERLLASRPPGDFVNRLQELQVEPLELGRVIVATRRPHQGNVLAAIQELGLEHQLIFNKGAVMVLPPGINKASGLHEALKELLLAEHNMVAIGDAENDHAMLQAAEVGVAVENAIWTLKTEADWTSPGSANIGVIELIERLLDDDLGSLDLCLKRHYLHLGQQSDGTAYDLSPYGNRILIAGSSCCGKTTLSTALLEQMITKRYQFCLIDPEGDYTELPGVINMGDDKQPPIIAEVVKVMLESVQNVSVCILAVPFHERPAFFNRLADHLIRINTATGRPHFLIMDEAHHLVPAEITNWAFDPNRLPNLLAVTTSPNLIHQDFLKNITILITMGQSPYATINQSKIVLGSTAIVPLDICLQKGDILVWQKRNREFCYVRTDLPKHIRRRHKRKYASGNLGMDSFYFTGPERKLNLMANNLMVFTQLASGLDASTWLYHLHRNDYSKWFRGSIKDDELANRTEKIENQEQDAQLSKNKIFELINKRYTGPA